MWRGLWTHTDLRSRHCPHFTCQGGLRTGQGGILSHHIPHGRPPAALLREMSGVAADAKAHQAASCAGTRGTCEWASVPGAGGSQHKPQPDPFCLMKGRLYRPAGCPREGRVHASRPWKMCERGRVSAVECGSVDMEWFCISLPLVSFPRGPQGCERCSPLWPPRALHGPP